MPLIQILLQLREHGTESSGHRGPWQANDRREEPYSLLLGEKRSQRGSLLGAQKGQKFSIRVKVQKLETRYRLHSMLVYHFVSSCRQRGIFFIKKKILFSIFSQCATCGVLVPRPGIRSVPPAVEEWHLNQRATREVPEEAFLEINTGSYIPAPPLMAGVTFGRSRLP